MRRYLFDAGIASNYINCRRGVFERAREEARGNRIGVSGINGVSSYFYT
jgi:hypothetical protein